MRIIIFLLFPFFVIGQTSITLEVGKTPPNYQLVQVAASTDMDNMDGNALVSHDGLLKNLGGWFGGSNSHNEQWFSSDGITWTEQDTALWFPRHTFGHGVDSDSNIWVWGGDLFYNGNAPKDVWKYDTEWTEITSDWGATAGERVLFAWAVHKDYLYMAGGQTDYSGSTMFTDIVRSADGITWTKIGDLPLSYFSTGVMISDGNNLYLIGGGRYFGTHDNYNNKVYKSTDDGATWTANKTLPIEMHSMYANGFYWDGRLWYLMGYSSVNGAVGNKSGLYYSSNGISWTLLSDSYPARHATGIAVHNDELYIVCGNLRDDVYKVTKN